MLATKKNIIVFIILLVIIFGLMFSCLKEDNFNYFSTPILALESIYVEYPNEEIITLDSTQFHTGSYLYILYNTAEESVTKIIIGGKSQNQYYIEERVPWYVIGNSENQTKIQYAVNGVHEIDGEIKKFYVWKGSYTIDDLKNVLIEFDKVDISNIKQSYDDIYSVFY